MQWKMVGIDHDWELVVSLHQFDDQGLMFRAKPEVRKCVGYRRYFYKVLGGGIRVLQIHQFGDMFTEEQVEKDKAFIKWLDKEWQYHEVEVESE